MDRERLPRKTARSDARRTGRTRVLIVGALFAAMLATALVIGSRFLSSPPADVRIAMPGEFRIGRLIHALPAGRGCRHFTFDNATGELGELGTGPCEYADPASTSGLRQAGKSQPGAFSWRGR